MISSDLQQGYRSMKKPLLVLVATAIIAMTATTGLADTGKRDHEKALELKESGDILPLEQILPGARAIHPGKVIETELDHRRGRYIYEIEILDSGGQVWEMKYDAHTGGLIKDKRDD